MACGGILLLPSMPLPTFCDVRQALCWQEPLPTGPGFLMQEALHCPALDLCLASGFNRCVHLQPVVRKEPATASAMNSAGWQLLVHRCRRRRIATGAFQVQRGIWQVPGSLDRGSSDTQRPLLLAPTGLPARCSVLLRLFLLCYATARVTPRGPSMPL